MGSVAAAFTTAFRDYVTQGLPASGQNEVIKREARAIGPVIEAALGTLSLGSVTTLKTTKALLDADLAHGAGSTGIVYADATDANNDLYVKSCASGAGAWTNTGTLHSIMAALSQPLIDAVAAVTPAIVASSGINQFNKNGLVIGYETNSATGELLASAESAVSNLIPVRGWRALTISGLTGSNPFDPFFSWLAADGETVLYHSFFDKGLTKVTLVPPVQNAWFFRFDVDRRDPTPGSRDAIQVQRGRNATTFQAFRGDLVVGLGRKALPQPLGLGGAGFILSDSIGQTTNVDAGLFLGGSGFLPNWPDVAMPKLGVGAYCNFARSGAHFADWAAPDSDFQKFSHQIDTAVSQAASLGISPDWTLTSLGTNDYNSSRTIALNLGDYATAMSKSLSFDGSGVPTTDLNAGISLEAARLGFARLRWHFPDTQMFCALPLQRAAYSADEMLPWVEAIAKMARAYGFVVIDCFSKSGVLHEFETVGAEGRKLVDGLHTNGVGRRDQGLLIATDIDACFDA